MSSYICLLVLVLFLIVQEASGLNVFDYFHLQPNKKPSHRHAIMCASAQLPKVLPIALRSAPLCGPGGLARDVAFRMSSFHRPSSMYPTIGTLGSMWNLEAGWTIRLHTCPSVHAYVSTTTNLY